jgi:hypothetical protein
MQFCSVSHYLSFFLQLVLVMSLTNISAKAISYLPLFSSCSSAYKLAFQNFLLKISASFVIAMSFRTLDALLFSTDELMAHKLSSFLAVLSPPFNSHIMPHPLYLCEKTIHFLQA